VETVSTLFTLADKCARAAEDHAWHSAPQTGVAQMRGSGAITQNGKKKKKNRGHEKPQFAASIVAAATGGRSERASDASSRPRMAPHPIADLVRRGSTMARWPRENENSGISHPRGTSRTSSPEIPTPVTTTTAARSCTSCTAGAGSSPPAGTSSPCAARSCRRLQGS
jgi:hypothetical protein